VKGLDVRATQKGLYTDEKSIEILKEEKNRQSKMEAWYCYFLLPLPFNLSDMEGTTRSYRGQWGTQSPTTKMSQRGEGSLGEEATDVAFKT